MTAWGARRWGNERLDVATNNFLKTFKEKYHYWDNIRDIDLNKEALAIKNKYKEFEEAYNGILKST